jgi:tetratricopeptide (TPR) repeat protein
MREFSNPNPPGKGSAIHDRLANLHQWSLHPWWRATFFSALVLAVSILLSYEMARVVLATLAVHSISIPIVEKAIKSDPGNPGLVHRLGLLYSYVPTELNLAASVKYLRQAAAMNPYHWDYWADLATTCDFVGDTPCSDAAFERARNLNPMTPLLQWMVANHYVLTNRAQESFPYFRKLLEMSPDYLAPTFRLLLRVTADPQQIYAGVVPDGKDPSPRYAFLTFLSTTGDFEGAMQIWKLMIAGPDNSPEPLSVKPFLDSLIEHNQIQDASVVWGDLAQRGLVPKRDSAEAGNLLYNGNFQGQPLNTGFDWRYNEASDLLYDFSDTQGPHGGKCLRIDFPVGRNEDYELLNQVVLVAPNTRYQLTAQVRSEDLTSDSGPRLRVRELGCPDCPTYTSSPTLGTTPWHPLEVTFTTREHAQAVRISFWRPLGQMPPRDISGTVWLDEVRLQASESPVGSLDGEGTH